MTQPMTIIFHNFPRHTKGMLHSLACQQLEEWKIAETDCLIGYGTNKRPDWPFTENHIEITAPRTASSRDMMPAVEAGMEIADMLKTPLVISREGARSITLPACRNTVPV